MHRKDIRNKINKKIDSNYNARQKVLTRIKNNLDIDFYKISIYTEKIDVKYPNDGRDVIQKDNNRNNILFKIELSASSIGTAGFYYKCKDIDILS
ncbi:MAG: hypothetical protein H0X03_02215, partial [Nitrosopumilus sp.]|nr:hypothetical protein [Nitrosopumilus sp.]